MIEINRKEISILEYEIEIEGLDLSDISEIRFSIVDGSLVHSILGNLSGKNIEFKLQDWEWMKNSSYQFFIEVMSKHYFFRVMEDTLQLAEPRLMVKMKDSFVTEQKTVKKTIPVVKLKI